MMLVPRVRLAACAAGGVLSVVADRSITKQVPSRRVTAQAVALVSAAGVYPIARLGRRTDRAIANREWVALLSTAMLAAGAAKLPERQARALVAVGWLAHAAFDRAHDGGDSSRLPDWYPALCAGYDIGIAGLLLVSSNSGHR